MTDLALIWDPAKGAADLALNAGQLVSDDGLRTAILLSLFCDARAPEGADLPEPGADRRGWWGDAFASAEIRNEADAIGSQLWLQERGKALASSAEQARRAAETALGWLIRDGVASAVRVEAEIQGSSPSNRRLALGVVLDRPDGPGRQRFDFVWNASTGNLS